MALNSSIVNQQQVREQSSLWGDGPMGENPDFLSKQLVTYIGNKRSLLYTIEAALDKLAVRLGKNKLRILDAFSGSGVVSRLFKAHSNYLVTCDLEAYAAVLGRCFLTNRSSIQEDRLEEIVTHLNHAVKLQDHHSGFIEELYAPRDEKHITAQDRVFYTKENARRLDRYRTLIEDVPNQYHDLLLGPLLGRASVHANTSGVFKGFHKNKATKVGQFGGSGRDALKRILGVITLEAPILSRFECEYDVIQGDINEIVGNLPEFDVAYLDPPYNQHPYGSNYFMLNLLTNYVRPSSISKVSGIPTDWNRSGYNVKQESPSLLENLVERLQAKYVLVSFNNEGFITTDEMESMLSKHGRVEFVNTKYNAFRGSRSFANRSVHVTEYLYTVEKY